MQNRSEYVRPVQVNHLASFAQHIYDRHRDDFYQYTYDLLCEFDVPLLRSIPQDESRRVSDQSGDELLTALIAGNPLMHIDKAIDRWKLTQFPKVQKNEMVVADVMRISKTRKLALLRFIPGYTSDASLVLELAKEIDDYVYTYATTTLHTFVNIIDERLGQQVAKLQETEELYKRAESIAGIGNWKWDVESDQVTWTDELFRLFGMEPQSRRINFHDYLQLVHPDDKEMITSHVTHSLQTRQPYQFFHRVILADGKMRVLNSRGEVVVNSDGKVTQLIGSAQDVTLLKETEQQLLEHQQILIRRTLELQQSNASLEEFAYVASHDLKEPLRKITIFIDRLETLRAKATKEENKLLDKVESSVVRLRKMVDDLLSLSLISADQDPSPHSLKTILDEVCIMLEAKIEETGAKITADPLPVVKVVATEFTQLFQNLIGNALKFTRSNITPLIHVGFRYVYPKDVRDYSVKAASRYVEITIRDNGIGFENEFTDRIFGVFQRLHPKDKYEGTGMGLAICRKIMMKYGGMIRASGVPGEGATFVLILPET